LELVMAEWGVSWDYIETHWTDRQYLMMVRRLAERCEKQTEQMKDVNKGRLDGGNTKNRGGRTMKFKDWLKENCGL
jgi:hypothetical protein